jgi:hypothetical protein
MNNISRYEVVLKADTNDGDYVTSTSTVDVTAILKLESIIRNLKAAGEAYSITWGRGDMMGKDNDPRELYKDVLTSEEIEWLDEMLPFGEYGIHTIESIVYYEAPAKVKLLG